MQTILDILNKAGGWHPGLYLKIDNAPYMELVIEAMDESGPHGLTRPLSIAHYAEQNGDLMRDPEMCFELGLYGGSAPLSPFYWRNDYAGAEEWSRATSWPTTTCTCSSCTPSTSASPRCGTATCVSRASPRPSTGRSTYARKPSSRYERNAGHRVRSPPFTASPRNPGEPPCRTAANSSSSPSTPPTSPPPNPRRTLDEGKLQELAERASAPTGLFSL